MTSHAPPEDDLHEVARAKLVHVLGERRGQMVFRETLDQLCLERVRTPDDLYVFAKALAGRGSFAGAIGGLLIVHALLRGARGEPPSKGDPPPT